MHPNPYEAPPFSPAPHGLPQYIRSGGHLGRFELTSLGWLGILLLAAFGHRCQLPELTPNVAQSAIHAYTHSPLIAAEIIGILGALVLLPILLGRAIFLLVQRRFWAALFALILCPVSYGAMFLAIFIDAPTLIHAT